MNKIIIIIHILSQNIGHRVNLTEDAGEKAKIVAGLREELKKAQNDLKDAKEAKEKEYNNLKNEKEAEHRVQAQEQMQAKKKKRKKRMIQVLKFTVRVAAAYMASRDKY